MEKGTDADEATKDRLERNEDSKQEGEEAAGEMDAKGEAQKQTSNDPSGKVEIEELL